VRYGVQRESNRSRVSKNVRGNRTCRRVAVRVSVCEGSLCHPDVVCVWPGAPTNRRKKHVAGAEALAGGR